MATRSPDPERAGFDHQRNRAIFVRDRLVLVAPEHRPERGRRGRRGRRRKESLLLAPLPPQRVVNPRVRDLAGLDRVHERLERRAWASWSGPQMSTPSQPAAMAPTAARPTEYRSAMAFIWRSSLRMTPSIPELLAQQGRA